MEKKHKENETYFKRHQKAAEPPQFNIKQKTKNHHLKIRWIRITIWLFFFFVLIEELLRHIEERMDVK